MASPWLPNQVSQLSGAETRDPPLVAMTTGAALFCRLAARRPLSGRPAQLRRAGLETLQDIQAASRS